MKQCSLFDFILFCMIMAGTNMVVLTLAANFPNMPPTFAEWIRQDHTFLIMFLVGLDMIAFSVFFMAYRPSPERKDNLDPHRPWDS